MIEGAATLDLVTAMTAAMARLSSGEPVGDDGPSFHLDTEGPE